MFFSDSNIFLRIFWTELLIASARKKIERNIPSNAICTLKNKSCLTGEVKGSRTKIQNKSCNSMKIKKMRRMFDGEKMTHISISYWNSLRVAKFAKKLYKRCKTFKSFNVKTHVFFSNLLNIDMYYIRNPAHTHTLWISKCSLCIECIGKPLVEWDSLCWYFLVDRITSQYHCHPL